MLVRLPRLVIFEYSVLLTFLRLQLVDLSLNCNAYIKSGDPLPVFLLKLHVQPLILQTTYDTMSTKKLTKHL